MELVDWEKGQLAGVFVLAFDFQKSQTHQSLGILEGRQTSQIDRAAQRNYWK
jgi:hypothetical protein